MQYQALYRKYRPQRFDEVVGQDHVTATLGREITEEKIAHAYLFAGPRGTGKTTTARLLAKSLNCTNLQPDGEPCNECTSCVAITEGASLDVIELDAASHNKVEDVREIRVNVGTVAAAADAKRVYILDEAHMLSRAAGNALLKTLEEPPEHVVFVMATTEPYKVLDTIRSRAQRFDFHPVASEPLIEYLGEIAHREGFDADPNGLAMVATHAKGSVRDAMSLLEQVAALGDGRVTSQGVARALGLADRDAYGALLDSIAAQDAPAALGLIARLSAQGSDLRRFVSEGLSFFRGIFLAHYAPNLEEVADEPEEVLDEWRRWARQVPPAEVLRAIDRFSEALAQLREGREERLVIELAVLRLARPETAHDTGAVLARLERVEQRLREVERSPGTSVPADSPGAAPELPASGAEVAEPAVDPVPSAAAADAATEADPAATLEVPREQTLPTPNGDDLDLDEVRAAWPAIVGRVRADLGARRHAFVRVAEPDRVHGRTVVLTVPAHQHFHLEQLRADTDLQEAVRSIGAEILGDPVALEFEARDGEDDAAPPLARVPDKEQLLEEGDAADDPTALVTDLLGAEVVSDE